MSNEVKLSAERIAKLAALKGVKKISVENFLGTLGGMSTSDAYANLRADARSYGWNAATVNAISKGIDELAKARRAAGV